MRFQSGLSDLSDAGLADQLEKALQNTNRDAF
jgi:hypothetical protein